MNEASERTRDIIGGALCMACGVVGVLGALDLPLGNLRLLGPGAIPLVLALLLLLFGAALLLRSLAGGGSAASAAPLEESDGNGHTRVGLVAVLIGLYVLALPTAGFLVASAVLMYALYAVGEGRVLARPALLSSVAATICGYLLFVVLLGVRFPQGILRGL